MVLDSEKFHGLGESLLGDESYGDSGRFLHKIKFNLTDFMYVCLRIVECMNTTYSSS